MNSLWEQKQFTLKRQVIALTGKIRIYTIDRKLCAYSEQKMFRLREDIRVYDDINKRSKLLMIQAQQIIDFAASYVVLDSRTAMNIGILRRRGFKSLLRDQWEILGPAGEMIGVIEEDSGFRSALRRFLLGTLLPQTYYLRLSDGTLAGTFRQRFHLFRYQLDLEFDVSPERFDRRLGLAGAILLAVIEGKQGE